MPCLVRPAMRRDRATILRFIRELADYEKLGDAVVATEALLEEHLFSAQPAARVLIAEQTEMAVGFCLFFRNFSTFLGRPGLYIEDLYVQESARGGGVGGALLRAVAGIALAEGCGRVEWSVLDWNQPAIDVYRRLGAEPMEGWSLFRLSGDALSRLAA